jgi:hypothetical protein
MVGLRFAFIGRSGREKRFDAAKINRNILRYIHNLKTSKMKERLKKGIPHVVANYSLSV